VQTNAWRSVEGKQLTCRGTLNRRVTISEETTFGKVSKADLGFAIEEPDANNIWTEAAMPNFFGMNLFEYLNDFDGKRAEVRDRGWVVCGIWRDLKITLGKGLFAFIASGDDSNLSPTGRGLP
jgi:hypothetical protein